MNKGEYRARVAAAVKKISSLPELVPADFILTNHKAEQQRQRVERAKKRIASLPPLELAR
jgi:hypothetical protein